MPSESKTPWTHEQERAIKTTGRSVLVSAAAGSGKTAVLAERCAYLVCDAPDKCGVDELLVVTFTNAAANEMRERIEHVLRDRLEKQDDPCLARQLALIERAQISTLHGFCSRIIKQNFHLLGIDPNCVTLDEDEATLLRNEVARELFADRYAGESAGEFQKFIDLYGSGNDEPLMHRVIRTHELLSSTIDPKSWVQRAMNRIASARKGDLRKSDLGAQLIHVIACGLVDLKRKAIHASERLSEMDGLAHYAEYVNELLAAIQDWTGQFADGDFDALSAAVQGFEMPKLTAVRGIEESLREAGKQIVDSVRKSMQQGTLFEVSRFNTAEWRDGLARIATPTRIFLDLTLEFSRRYRKAKDEIRAMDFSDLERHALKILRDERFPDQLVPTDAARAYHGQFAHVLVDEYQDINAVQDAILTLVSRPQVTPSPCTQGEGRGEGSAQNLFCVGDVKQSIYRFRLAEPKRFLDRAEKFRNGDDGVGEVIDLSHNFRTRAPLIDVLNEVFSRLMTKDAAEITYDNSHALRAAFPYPSDTTDCLAGAPVEIHLVPKPPRAEVDSDPDSDELDRSEREAVVIAHRIRELMGQGEKGAPKARVFDKSLGALREIRYRDIVILLRSMRVKADQFAEQLRAAGVPVHSDSGTGFFESMEVRDILSLLRLLDNQRQDVPMAAVLRSPLAKLPNADDCLARVRLAFRGKSIPFHEAVVRFAHQGGDEIAASLLDFLQNLGRWRTLAHRRPLAEVLWRIYDETGYLAFCAGLEDGEQRVANLIALHERARQFGTFQRQGLGRFMQFVKNLQEQSDLGQPSVASEADDVVRIMSVHRSKGLEFPVVFLPDLGKRHNFADSRGIILVDREAYVGLQAVDEEKRIRYPSLPWVLCQEKLKRQMLAEELRVLYVAMTRAREHLILVGTCDEKTRNGWEDWKSHEGALPNDVILGCNTMLDWIGPVAAAIESSKPGSFTGILHDDEQIQQWAGQIIRRPALSEDQKKLAKLDPLDPSPAPDKFATGVIDRMTAPYAWNSFTRLPAVASVTSLTKSGRAAPGGESASRADLVSFDLELAAPRCVAKDQRATPTEVGSATHLVLQYLDFTKASSAAEIERQLEAMTRRKLVLAAHAKIVDREAIQWLAQSELGLLLNKHHSQLRRELPVYFAQPAADGPNTDGGLDRVMIRGRLDVMLPLDDGLLIADYKTDRVTADTIDARAEFYREQITSYADAIARISGQPVNRIYLAFLAPRILRRVES
jgi:ATP-dependent helicase/nuclease subunit A